MNAVNGGDDIQQWLERARDYDGKMKFDFEIVNDNFESAYKKFKEFVLRVYQEDMDKENSLK
jgi:guanylate kinase